MEQDWHEVIKMIFTDRVKLLPPDTRVDRFLELEGHADTPALITDILMTEATTALDEIMFRRVSMHVHSIHFIYIVPSANNTTSLPHKG